MTVHVPIGLLIGNAILTLLYLRRNDASFEIAAYHCLWLGVLGILPAVAAGTWDAVQHLNGPQPHPDALLWINAHAASGLIMTVLYWQAWQIRRRNPQILAQAGARNGYLARLALGVSLLVLSGWIGGHMVYVLRIAGA